MSPIATHLPFCALALSLNIYLSRHTYRRLPRYQGLRTPCSSLATTEPSFPLCSIPPAHFSPFSNPALLGRGGAPCCRCDPGIFVLSYEGMLLGPSVVFVQKSGTSRNLSTRYQGCLAVGLSSSCGRTGGSSATGLFPWCTLGAASDGSFESSMEVGEL